MSQKQINPRQKFQPNTTGDVLQVKEYDPNSGKGIIKDYSLAELAEMPLPVYYRKKDRVMNARRKRWFERVLFDPAQPIPANLNYRIFDRGPEDKALYANTGQPTGDDMTEWHTNLQGDGEFDPDQTVIIHELDIRFRVANVLATWTNGVLTNPVVGAETNFSATALFQMLTENLRLTFYRGDTPQESGFLHEWFTANGATGTFGGDSNEGFIQLAFPDHNEKFDRVKIFENGNSKFHARIDNPSGHALTLPAVAVPVLDVGLRSRTITTLYY